MPLVSTKLPLLQGEGWGEDGYTAETAKPIPTLILPLKGRIRPNESGTDPDYVRKSIIMFEQELEQLQHQNLLRSLMTVDGCTGSRITVNGSSKLLLCSNDYLDLANHPALKEAACNAMSRYGFGSGASRLISGTSPLHRDLENRLAQFKGTESALLFNSGYAANTGIIPAIVDAGDVVLSDELNHASIIDGCRMSRASVLVFRHRDVEHLETLLGQCRDKRRRLIVTDGVFSMDGDIAPLPVLVDLAERNDALLMVDDAHAVGVLGRTGRGTAEHFGMDNRIPIQMGTLGKALGSFGAYAAGRRDLIELLINRARSFMFSTSLPPAVCAASLAALDIVQREPERRARLWQNRTRFVQDLATLGISVGASETPIIPIMINDPRKALDVAARLFENGVYAIAVRPPTVPDGSARIRATVTAAHVENDIDEALEAFSKLKKEGWL